MAEVLETRNETAEKAAEDLTSAERSRLIDEYNAQIQEALKDGNTDMADYYREKLEPIKEASNRYWKEYWENKRVEIRQENAERQKRMTEENIKRRTPNYGTPTTEDGWASKAASEFEKNGESWYYNVCMKEAAKCHVNEALNKK